MTTTKKAKRQCAQCGSQNIKSCITTYPVKIGAKQMNVGRVSVRECLDCHAMTPTDAGKAKIGSFIMAFDACFGLL